MIELHRPHGFPIYVNAELIELVERASDDEATLVTLTTGNTIAVVELPDIVRDRAVAYKRRINGIE